MEFLLPYLPFLIPILVIIVILLLGYVKAPPDQAYIISGLRKNSRILIGQAGSASRFWSGWISCL